MPGARPFESTTGIKSVFLFFSWCNSWWFEETMYTFLALSLARSPVDDNVRVHVFE